MSFPAVNEPGAVFEAQIQDESRLKQPTFDPFAVLGLHADDTRLTLRAVRSHIRKIVMPHVFERGAGDGAKTKAPGVPTWKQVNMIKEKLSDLNERDFRELKAAWSQRSRQTWDPFQAVGSLGATRPPVAVRVLPPHYYAVVEEVEDEYDAIPRAQGQGTSNDPFFFESDDEDDDEEEDDEENDDDDGDNGEATASSPPLFPPPPITPSRTPAPPGSRPTPQKRRLVPQGILLGTWRHSGLPAADANAVYVSRDKRNRINRRISKETQDGRLARSDYFDARKTACSHEDIDHIPEFRGMTREEINSHVMPLLASAGEDPGEDPTTPSRRSKQTTASTHQPRGATYFVDDQGNTYT